MGNKNICIVTWHKVPNYGAQLQAYALQNVMKEWGANVVFYDYERKVHQHNLYTCLIHPINTLKNILDCKTTTTEQEKSFYDEKNNLLQHFVDENFVTSDSNTNYDLTVIGADEIFSIADGYNGFQFGDGVRTRRIISYAASFGSTTYGMILFYGKKKRIKDFLNRFSDISVRDQNSKQIIKKLLLKDVSTLIDPVLLWDWKKEKEKFSQKAQDIILFYSYGTHKITNVEKKEILDFAHSNGLKVVSVGYYHPWCDSSICVTSMEFVELVYSAKYIVTTTFHGTVFSLLFDKKFAVILQNNNREKLGFLLDDFNAKKHLVNDNSICEILQLEDKYSEILIKKRKIAYEYLSNSLSNI